MYVDPLTVKSPVAVCAIKGKGNQDGGGESGEGRERIMVFTSTSKSDSLMKPEIYWPASNLEFFFAQSPLPKFKVYTLGWFANAPEQRSCEPFLTAKCKRGQDRQSRSAASVAHEAIYHRADFRLP